MKRVPHPGCSDSRTSLSKLCLFNSVDRYCTIIFLAHPAQCGPVHLTGEEANRWSRWCQRYCCECFFSQSLEQRQVLRHFTAGGLEEELAH
jgi:hypothetical protein